MNKSYYFSKILVVICATLFCACGDPDEHPVKGGIGGIRLISSNGPVTFKLIQGGGVSQAV